MEPQKRNPGLDVLRALRRVASVADDQSRALADEIGLTVPQLLCLKAIADANPAETTVAWLSETVSLAPSTVSGILDRLERARLVRRKRDRRDRRQVHLSVTQAARGRLARVPDLCTRIGGALQSFDDEERERTVVALRGVLDVLEGAEPSEALRIA